jgi:crotonobetainyl-CoA:carnitine CoA-transferase CaiB-like acyl-CoA transferase
MELIRTCDVVVESYTPRVLNQLGLDWDTVRKQRSDLLLVRMPGFGLDGPWRDVPAFAYVVEHASGLTWITGYPEDRPVEPFCVGDPNAGLHAVLAVLVALENRDRTGQGALVEAAMIDAALNITAEQFIEYSANGVLLNRAGNRGPMAAPQGVYQAAGVDEYGRDDVWVALAVADDSQWEALRLALGDPEWARDTRLVTAAGRRARHDEIDAHLASWFRMRESDEAVATLWRVGVPVAKVTQPHRQVELAQLDARGFLEEVEHPVAGKYRQSTLPFHWPASRGRLTLRHAPLLGEHNAEILGGLGLSTEELAQLERDGVIGTSPAGMG